MVVQTIKNLPVTQETQVWFVGRKIPWRRSWHPTSIFLLGKSHGQRSLVGYSPWSCKELDVTERLSGCKNAACPWSTWTDIRKTQRTWFPPGCVPLGAQPGTPLGTTWGEAPALCPRCPCQPEMKDTGGVRTTQHPGTHQMCKGFTHMEWSYDQWKVGVRDQFYFLPPFRWAV